MNNEDSNHRFVVVEWLGQQFKTAGEEAFNRLISVHTSKPAPKPLLLAHHNVNSLSLLSKDKTFRAYFNSVNYIWIDGLPVALMLRILGHPVHRHMRLTFLDWQRSFWPLANKNKWRVFVLGGQQKTIDKATSILSERYNEISFIAHHGYFSNRENEQVLAEINAFKPDVLMLAMGMPRQELWIHENHEMLNAKVVMPIGGYFDYIAGKTYIPPRWSGKLGLEWLFRLVADPSRLSKRYLLEPWPVFIQFLRQFLSNR